MNIYTVLFAAATIYVPLALLYRALNPAESTEKARKRLEAAAWEIERKNLPLSTTPAGISLHPLCRREDYDRLQSQRQATHNAKIALQRKEQAAWNASITGRVISVISHILVGLLAAVFFVLLIAFIRDLRSYRRYHDYYRW